MPGQRPQVKLPFLTSHRAAVTELPSPSMRAPTTSYGTGSHAAPAGAKGYGYEMATTTTTAPGTTPVATNVQSTTAAATV